MSPHDIVYRYRIDGRLILVRRRLVGTAYPRNGNVGNATRYYTWSATVDGENVASGCSTRASAYEHARAHVAGIAYFDHPNHPTRWTNVRNFVEVEREMRNNYAGREII